MKKEEKEVSENWLKLVEAIPDIEQYIREDKIKVIRINKFTKDRPSDNDYYNKIVSLEELKQHKGNYGLIVGYNNKKNGSSIAVIDIDGYTIKESDNIPMEKKEEIKQATKEYIFNCLKDIPEALIVRTQSGGYHLYLWNEEEVDNIHNISKCLKFPSDFQIEELRNKPLRRSIEIFTKFKSKYVDLASNVVKNGTNYNTYDVISDMTKLADIGTVNNVHEVVKETMMANNYGYDSSLVSSSENRKKSRSKKNRRKNSSNSNLRKLNKTDVVKVVDVVTTKYKVFEAIDGAKHDGALA